MIAVVGSIVLFLSLAGCIAWPLGRYIAYVMSAPVISFRPFAWFEEKVKRFLGAAYSIQMTWKEYFFSFLTFHTVGLFFLFFLIRYQHFFDARIEQSSADTAFNAAVSFVTNTNWQSYIPELDMSWFVYMIGVTSQQFLTAAAGLTILCVLARAFRSEEQQFLGNFWQDILRSSVLIFLPLAMILSCLLVATGVPQSLSGEKQFTTLESTTDQKIPIGMYASQVAIKQLGTNGGGVFRANAAHPFENPSPASNIIELLAILLIPMALCRTFGEMVGSPRQGMVFLCVMSAIFLLLASFACSVELCGHPCLSSETESAFQIAGNMEGKETRFGRFWSVLWAASTTATANGSVSSNFSSFFPLTGGVCLIFLHLGETIFGGIGTGMTTAVVFLLIAIFSAGLMVGRTPEYLGKKIEVHEMKLVTLLAIFPAALVLLGTALVLEQTAGRASLSTYGPHGLTEVLYAFSSSAANNGSSFQGLHANVSLYNFLLGIVMYLARFFPIGLTLALSSLIAKKKRMAENVGTLPTDSVAFGIWFAFVILIIGALNFLPVFTLGPVIEHMLLFFPTSS